MRDFSKPIESIEDLEEEEIPNLSDDVKNALRNAFKDQGQKGGKQGGGE